MTKNTYGAPSLLALFIGQRLCIDFSVLRSNFLTTLHSPLDVTCSCYFIYLIYLMWILTIVIYIYFIIVAP